MSWVLVLVVFGRVAVEWGQVPGGIVRRVCHRTVCWLQSAAWPFSRLRCLQKVFVGYVWILVLVVIGRVAVELAQMSMGQ